MSVVIAAVPEGAGLPECLDSLATQRAAASEVLVVSSAPDEGLRTRYPWVVWVPAPASALVPQLWSFGIAAAAGEVVALTSAHFEPAPDWVEVIHASHARLDAPAIGGPIDPPPSGVLAWATYFLRYSAYLNYRREQAVPDLAADNASYKREVVLAYPEFLVRGFWEQELHARLRSAGQRLVFVPSMRVRLRRSFGFVPFVRQRLRHGREFGLARLSAHGLSWRVAAIAGSPLIPTILLTKVGLRVLRSRRALAWFVAALPALCAFVLAWSAGEASAYAVPGRRAAAV